MDRRMSEHELLNSFDEALMEKHIFVMYQPKINHVTGRMVGAEALMRWRNPEYGMQYPSEFIPVLENNNLIYRADIFVFEQICAMLRKRLDEKKNIVPISFNMSRVDIYNTNYVDEIENIRKKYRVPVKFLRVEITESSAVGGIELISNVLDKLHELGYIVEMDDFGSGYSSLNVLKDLPVDIIKLDMRFLSGDIGGRGGTIISSVVQMSKWLNTPVIAEGVETIEQADYMKSIGCKYIQGYLYSKPITEEEFLDKLDSMGHEPVGPAMDLISTMDAGKFWNPESLETLIFNNYVGGAAIFVYHKDGRAEILRVNEKYIKEVGMNQTELEILRSDTWACFDEKNKEIFVKTLEKAIASRDEETCETWRHLYSDCCGEDEICVRSFVRMIGNAEDQYIFYAMVQNITNEKKLYEELYNSERRFRFASEQINAYAWEVDLTTRVMKPCFRCMRDLNLPPVVRNYPEPAIESGIFPADYADMYRDWMRQLEEGVGTIEGIIPLTAGRIPFHVRYTTEFDENGKPLKAYGSAALVVDGEDGNSEKAADSE